MTNTTVVDCDILKDRLDECESMNKALTVFMGEVANVLEELAGSQEACTICAGMGEKAGERIGEKIGKFDNVGEALDAFVHHTKSWYNIEIDSIEDNVAIKLVIGTLIIIAIIALNSPLKLRVTRHAFSSIDVISAVRVKGNLSLAAPKTILSLGFCSFLCKTICGIPFKAKRNRSSLMTSNLSIFSGINLSKFLRLVKNSKTSLSLLFNVLLVDSICIIFYCCHWEGFFRHSFKVFNCSSLI